MERETLRVVVDTNEFVFALTGPAASAPYRLLELLLDSREQFEVRIPQTIAAESIRNLPGSAHPRFFALLNALTAIDPDYLVPFEVGERYRVMGMKTGDALIAAYCDWIETDLLVSENRHFLVEYRPRPDFDVVTAESLVQRYGGSPRG